MLSLRLFTILVHPRQAHQDSFWQPCNHSANLTIVLEICTFVTVQAGMIPRVQRKNTGLPYWKEGFMARLFVCWRGRVYCCYTKGTKEHHCYNVCRKNVYRDRHVSLAGPASGLCGIQSSIRHAWTCQLHRDGVCGWGFQPNPEDVYTWRCQANAQTDISETLLVCTHGDFWRLPRQRDIS